MGSLELSSSQWLRCVYLPSAIGMFCALVLASQELSTRFRSLARLLARCCAHSKEFSRSDPVMQSTLDLSKIGGSLPATSPVTPSRPPPPPGDPTHVRHNGLAPECFNGGGSAVCHDRVVTRAPHAAAVGEDGGAYGAADSRAMEGKRVEATVASTAGSRAEHAVEGGRLPSEDARVWTESAKNSSSTRNEACAACGRMTSRVCSSCLQVSSLHPDMCWARGCRASWVSRFS